jgi:hypothetical protein
MYCAVEHAATFGASLPLWARLDLMRARNICKLRISYGVSLRALEFNRRAIGMILFLSA